MMPKPIQVKHDAAITIAIGRTLRDTNWKNTDMAWSEFLKRVCETKRTPETFSEYLGMKRQEQTDVKGSAGGFVGGVLKGGRRKNGAVTWRQLITLDADFASVSMWDDFTMFNGYACAMYSTHTHRPEKPRLRFIIPLLRPVTPEEYQCIARTIAGDIGIDFWDDTTYEPNRLMFFPTTASDGEYLFKYQDAAWLDPDAILGRYEDWRDASFWPESERTKTNRRKLRDKAENPLEKKGVVGQFCRTYDIKDAIDVFLGDIYEEAGPGRYTYLAGTSVGGLVLYDDSLFAYSHHSTDPVGSRLVNAFDLVRIHKFEHLDDGDEKVAINRLPSYKAMLNLVNDDEKVAETAAVERIKEAGYEFSDGEDTTWIRRMQRTEFGRFAKNAHNVKLVLQHDAKIAGKFALNEFTGQISVLGNLPWRDTSEGERWVDIDDAGLRNYLSESYGISGRPIILDGFLEVASKLSFHPVQDYLAQLKWDGVERVDTLLTDYLGAEDSGYTRAIARKTLVAGVARIMSPGIKFDNVLTLCGPQGHNKSEIVRRLGRGWASDSFITFSGKEAYEQLQGAWLIEMAELAAMRRAEIEGVKHFITKSVDRYRAAYGRNIQEYPRQCIFIATTNEEYFLRDTTGNRRFWVVNVDKHKARYSLWNKLTPEVVDQLWAEAKSRWNDGEPLSLDKEIEATATEIQASHVEDDGRLGTIAEFLETTISEGWYDLDDSTRRMRLSGDFADGDEKAGLPRDRVCAAEIWVDCFGYDIGRLTPGIARELNGILKKIPGWSPYGGKLRFGTAFGVQRAFVKDREYGNV